jgi:outer membrane protein assembly factor BamA
MTAGADLFIREIDYTGLYTQKSAGGNLVYGFQIADFARMFINYSYERVQIEDLNPAFNDPRTAASNPILADSLLSAQGGHRTISKIGPSYVYNTVDSPIFPTTGARYTASMDVAGLGGNTKFINPRAEVIRYWAQTRRTSLGFRVSAEYIRPLAGSVLPIFEKIFQGGEYTIRGFDLRTIGPRDPISGYVIGGNKSILGNVEYLINIAGPVRLVLFADAGQVRDTGEKFAWKEDHYVQQLVPFPSVVLSDPFATVGLRGDANQLFPDPQYERVKIGETSAFKSSIGAEIRFFMPVLNVPFRLIFAMNPSRGGVLDNSLQPEKKWKFRFAVGSTF